jgi:hypothetical protein
MTTQHNQAITKILVSAAIALGASVGGAALASADPNPFGALSCSCQDTAAAAGSPALREEIDRGIRAGLSAPLPGPLAPA